MDVFAELVASLDAPWKRDALCRDHPHLNWFPERGASTTEQRVICARCLVRDECLDHAMTFGEIGVWGGTSGRDRRALRVTVRQPAA